MEGWIKLHRQLFENRLWLSEPFSRGQAWVDLLLLANHEPSFYYKRGNKINVERGQIGRSEVELSSRWTWSRTKLRRFLNDLEKEQQIIQQKSTVTLIITIVNYEKYQEKEQQTGQQKNSRKTAEKHIQECKEEKEVNNTSSPVPVEVDADEFYLTKKQRKLTGRKLEAFNVFWQKFNYQKGKAEAADAWIDIAGLSPKICTQINAAAEIEASKRPDLIQAGKTPKMAQGWLSARRWEDEIYIKKEIRKQPQKPEKW